jgi:hypothetical protein
VIPRNYQWRKFWRFVMGTHGHTGFKDLLLNYRWQIATQDFDTIVYSEKLK